MIGWNVPLAPRQRAAYSAPGTLGEPAMAKKSRKRAAAKAAKKSKGSKKKKTTAAKKGRKAVARKKFAAKTKLITKARPARKIIRKPPPESFVHKVEDVITGIGDIFTDAERLHQKRDPGISREPE
jgi:hypothetical protein